MKMYCDGCKIEHEDYGWVYREYQVSEEERKYGHFCSKFHKVTPFHYHSWNCDYIREKHAKDIEQPFISGEPNKKFADMYKNEPEKLTKIYDNKQLKKVGMDGLQKSILSE